MGDATLSVVTLVAANALPVLGVLALGWSVFPIVLLYWLENAVVGVFTVLKMLLAGPDDTPQLTSQSTSKAFLIPFFMFHFGMFTTVHGVFVFTLFGAQAGFKDSFPTPGVVFEAIRATGVGFAAAALFVSHGVSFFKNYLWEGESERASLALLMMQPYGRVVVLHVTILGGGFLVQALGSPLPALLLLVVLKTALDVRAHLAERRRFAPLPPDPARTILP